MTWKVRRVLTGHDAQGRSTIIADAIGAGHTQDRGSRDAMMHKTATVDYAIVLKGEITAVMVAFILVSAKPLK